MTVVVIDVDLVSVDFFVSLAYGPCREDDTRSRNLGAQSLRKSTRYDRSCVRLFRSINRSGLSYPYVSFKPKFRVETSLICPYSRPLLSFFLFFSRHEYIVSGYFEKTLRIRWRLSMKIIRRSQKFVLSPEVRARELNS